MIGSDIAAPSPKSRGSRLEPAWHAEARRLRASGAQFSLIARAVGRSEPVVREFLDENGEQAKKRERAARWRDGKADAEVKPFTGRAPRQILADAETKRAAFEAFAAGRIDRACLMRAITVGTPDTAAALAQRAGAL